MRSILVTLIFAFCLFSGLLGQAQTNHIQGKVLDENGMGLPGVAIAIKGTTSGTITDLDGNFALDVESGVILQVSFVGYITQEVSVTSQTFLKISLQPDVEQLEEIVVIGYGTQKKSDLTGSTGIVTMADADLQPIQRVEDVLQGRVSGVFVSQNSGAPGSVPRVNIRGFTGSPVYVIDGFIDGDINTLNPDDIENVSVLKDASATAIYGSRGANGVIIVTTKQGAKNKKLKINAEYYHSMSVLGKKLDLLDPVSYMKIVNKKRKEANGLEAFSDEEIELAETTPGFGTDWQDEIFRPAHADNLSVSASKGWKNTSLRASLSARNDNGIIKNSDYQRYTTRLKLNSKLTAKTNLQLNAAHSYERTHNLGDRYQGTNPIVAAATAWPPNLPVYTLYEKTDTTYTDYTGFQGYGPTVRLNPMYQVNEKDAQGKSYNTNGNISIQQEILKGLKFKLFGAAQYATGEGRTFTRYKPETQGSFTELNESETNRYKYQGNAQIDYSGTFSENHNLNITSVFETLVRRYKRTSLKTTFLVPGEEGVPGATGWRDEPERMLSFLSRLGYSFKEKILFTGSMRMDGSSRLPENNKWESYFSGALAYRLSDEAFLTNSNAVDDLKLRLGYGEIGNVSSIPVFAVQDLTSPRRQAYVFDGVTPVDGEAFENGNKRSNPYLRWESSRQWNSGIDLVLWGGKVEIVADYYAKFTEDSHFNKPVAGYLGGGSIKTNSGRFLNKGIEFQMINKWSNNSGWDIKSSINLTFNKSKVLEMPQDTIFAGSKLSEFDKNTHVLIEGQEVGQFWGYRYLGPKLDGADPLPGEIPNLKPGDAIYKDNNGDGYIGVEDMEVLGNGHPNFVWGYNLTVGYKNWSLNAFITGTHGVKMYNIPQHGLIGGGAGVLDATSTEILKSWSINKNGELPALTAIYRAQSSLFIENSSFIRMRNLTLAYEFNGSLKERLKIEYLRIYAGAQNLFTITDYTGYDPESKSGWNTTPGVDLGSFPVPRVYTIGMNLRF
ncbi:MAG: TonB-dependent receptor [Bacteroidota bacterium]